jgi:hypothetical protein
MEREHGGEEKRRDSRLEAESWLRAEYGGRQFAVRDIGLSGAWIRTADPLPVGTELELNLVSGRMAESIEVTAVVARCEPGGMAVRFTQFHRLAKGELEKMLLQRGGPVEEAGMQGKT